MWYQQGVSRSRRPIVSAIGGVAVATAIAEPLVSRVFVASFFLFIALPWDFFGGFLGTHYGAFSLGLALQHSIGRNTLGGLGLFDGFEIEACNFIFVNQSRAKFFFSSLS